MASSGLSDRWVSGSAYESYMGRWSRLVAERFLAWLDMPPGGDWIDVGCGTGALTEVILATAEPSSVLGTDPSAVFIEHARTHVLDDRVRFAVGDAAALPAEPGSVDVAVSGLVLNFVPDPIAALTEMARVVRPGGVIGGYVWDYAGEMQMLRRFWEAARVLDASALELDEGVRFPLSAPKPLAEVFRRAGLTQVEIEPVEVATNFRDFDDFWQPFLSGTGPAPAYVASLDEDARTTLRDYLRTALPVERDGSIRLIAHAWAARGYV